MLANYKLKLMDYNNSESNNLSVTNGEPTSNGHEIKREGKFYKMSTGQKKNFISNPIDEGIWLRGKIVYTHNKNEKIFKYYIEHNQENHALECFHILPLSYEALYHLQERNTLIEL